MKYLSTTATVCRDKSKATGEKTLSIILPTELHGVSSKAGLEPATHGVTGEVSLIYGTHYIQLVGRYKRKETFGEPPMLD